MVDQRLGTFYGFIVDGRWERGVVPSHVQEAFLQNGGEV